MGSIQNLMLWIAESQMVKGGSLQSSESPKYGSAFLGRPFLLWCLTGNQEEHRKPFGPLKTITLWKYKPGLPPLRQVKAHPWAKETPSPGKVAFPLKKSHGFWGARLAAGIFADAVVAGHAHHRPRASKRSNGAREIRQVAIVCFSHCCDRFLG